MNNQLLTLKYVYDKLSIVRYFAGVEYLNIYLTVKVP